MFHSKCIIQMYVSSVSLKVVSFIVMGDRSVVSGVMGWVGEL